MEDLRWSPLLVTAALVGRKLPAGSLRRIAGEKVERTGRTWPARRWA